MNASPDPLDRLFRAAARASDAAIPSVPRSVEAGVLAELRAQPTAERDPWFAFLPLFRAGLAVAASLVLLAVLIGLKPATPAPSLEAEEDVFLTSAIELNYLP